MRARLLRWFIGRVFDGLSRGEIWLAMALVGEDVTFRFPGRHAFSADHDDPRDVADWLRRFAAFRPRLEIDDVAVAGPPWDMRAFVRYRDRIDDPPSGGPYTNEICSFLRIRWVRITEYQVYLDTQRVAEHFGDAEVDRPVSPRGGSPIG